jgi:N-methylhydantoinase A
VAPVTTPGPARFGPARTRRAWLQEREGYVEVAVHRQDELDPDVPIRGPAIVEQPETTTVIGPADVARADAEHTLVISIGRDR